MRKWSVSLIVTLLVGLSPVVASAQTNGGIVAGVGFAGVQADDDDLQDASNPDWAYSVGIQGRIGVWEFLSVQPELHFARRIWRLEGEAIGFDFDAKYEFSYFELPVLLRASGLVTDFMAPKLFVGPHAALFVDGSREEQATSPFIVASRRSDIDSEDVNNFQWGLTAGGGFDFQFDGFVLGPEVRYVRNFTSIFENSAEDEEIRHETWQLMLSMQF